MFYKEQIHFHGFFSLKTDGPTIQVFIHDKKKIVILPIMNVLCETFVVKKKYGK